MDPFRSSGLDRGKDTVMSTYILVHGSFHGGWTWDSFAPLLKAAGHTVLCPTLPGSAGDPISPEQATLERYVESIVALIDGAPEPVILAGHSMGGIVVTQTAELRPDRIRMLVYICGFLFVDGESLTGFLDDSKDLAGEELVLNTMIVAPDGLSSRFPPERAPEIFYNCCSGEAASWASSRLAPQPMAVYGTPVRLTPESFGRVPKLYIETLQDRAIDIAYQRKMTGRTPCGEVFTLDTDHSPFLSMPRETAAILLSA
jgi:pimeloyl-ACP methyl ester carboxylesterase